MCGFNSKSLTYDTNTIFPFSSIINSSVVVAVFQSTHALHIWLYMCEYVHGGLVVNCHQMEHRALSEMLWSLLWATRDEAYQYENSAGYLKYRCKTKPLSLHAWSTTFHNSNSREFKLLMHIEMLSYIFKTCCCH